MQCRLSKGIFPACMTPFGHLWMLNNNFLHSGRCGDRTRGPHRARRHSHTGSHSSHAADSCFCKDCGCQKPWAAGWRYNGCRRKEPAGRQQGAQRDSCQPCLQQPCWHSQHHSMPPGTLRLQHPAAEYEWIYAATQHCTCSTHAASSHDERPSGETCARPCSCRREGGPCACGPDRAAWAAAGQWAAQPAAGQRSHHTAPAATQVHIAGRAINNEGTPSGVYHPLPSCLCTVGLSHHMAFFLKVTRRVSLVVKTQATSWLSPCRMPRLVQAICQVILLM